MVANPITTSSFHDFVLGPRALHAHSSHSIRCYSDWEGTSTSHILWAMGSNPFPLNALPILGYLSVLWIPSFWTLTLAGTEQFDSFVECDWVSHTSLAVCSQRFCLAWGRFRPEFFTLTGAKNEGHVILMQSRFGSNLRDGTSGPKQGERSKTHRHDNNHVVANNTPRNALPINTPHIIERLKKKMKNTHLRFLLQSPSITSHQSTENGQFLHSHSVPTNSIHNLSFPFIPIGVHFLCIFGLSPWTHNSTFPVGTYTWDVQITWKRLFGHSLSIPFLFSGYFIHPRPAPVAGKFPSVVSENTVPRVWQSMMNENRDMPINFHVRFYRELPELVINFHHFVMNFLQVRKFMTHHDFFWWIFQLLHHELSHPCSAQTF